MLNLILPVGNSFGWGICGKHLALELSRRTPIRLITETLSPESVGDELACAELQRYFVPLPHAEERHDSDAQKALHSRQTIQAIRDVSFAPWGPDAPAAGKIGYTFFEENLLRPQALETAKRTFDCIITGSLWCENVLRAHGLTEVRTVVQGIDPKYFHAVSNEKSVFRDRFVVFSGGKFEFRKGQDIVMRAVQIMQQRHDDVWLVHAWYNPWIESMRTMAASKLIRYAINSNEYVQAMQQMAAANGLDPERVIVLGPKPHRLMPAIYKNTDVGLFPNRCEGGTNLVLMEYMACGKPVIASRTSGQAEIISPENALLIEKMEKITITRGDRQVAEWDDPDVEETLAQLEFAYQNREALLARGRQAGEDLQTLTWSKMADGFLQVVREIGAPASDPIADAGDCVDASIVRTAERASCL